MSATQVPSPVKAPDVWLDVYIAQSNADDSHVSFKIRGLAKTPAGRTIDRTRSAPGRGFVRPMETHVPCTADAFARRVPHARGVIATNPRVGSELNHRRAKTSASRSIGRTSPPFAQVQPRRRLNNSHDDDANEWFVRNLDETSTRMNEFTNRTRESGASSL